MALTRAAVVAALAVAAVVAATVEVSEEETVMVEIVVTVAVREGVQVVPVVALVVEVAVVVVAGRKERAIGPARTVAIKILHGEMNVIAVSHLNPMVLAVVAAVDSATAGVIEVHLVVNETAVVVETEETLAEVEAVVDEGAVDRCVEMIGTATKGKDLIKAKIFNSTTHTKPVAV